MVVQKRSGPNGSPCCEPSTDMMTYDPKYRNNGCAYDDKQKAHSSGRLSLMDRSMSDLCKLLNALVKSSLTITWSGGKVCKQRRAEWMAASHPPVMPTPSCRGPNKEAMRAVP